MKRKFDKKSLLGFYAFGFIVLMFILLIGFIAFKGMQKKAKPFVLSANSIIYDENNHAITVSEEATIKKKWDDNYYLVTAGNKEYCLGSNAVAYEAGAK